MYDRLDTPSEFIEPEQTYSRLEINLNHSQNEEVNLLSSEADMDLLLKSSPIRTNKDKKDAPFTYLVSEQIETTGKIPNESEI